MKTKILSTVAAAALALSALTAANAASAKVGFGFGYGHGDAYYQGYGVSEYEYRKLCRRLNYNWKVLGNLKAKELFFRWNCFKFYGY